MKLLGSYWSGYNYDGFPIHPVAIPCLADEEPYTYADKEALDAFMKKSCREISGNALDRKLVQELQFLRVHMVRELNYLQFAKCTKPACSHCSTRPVVEKRMMEFLRSSPGGRVFTPKPSVSDKGHFISWLECCTQSEMKFGLSCFSRRLSLHGRWHCEVM